MAVEEWMGWGLSTLVVVGIGAIVLVAVWPRWRRWRVFREASRHGFPRLPLESAEARHLQAPVAADLLGLGSACRLRAAWKLPLPEGYVASVRCRYRVPRPGGTRLKEHFFTHFLLLKALPVRGVCTVQNRPPDNPLARLAIGMIEQRTGVHSVDDATSLPLFRARFVVRTTDAGVRLPDAFQRACLDRDQGGDGPLDLGRLLGEEGSLAVTPHGLQLTLGSDYAPRGVAELQAVTALLGRLSQSL